MFQPVQSTVRPMLALALTGVTLAAAPGALAQDVFSPGLRWKAQPAQGELDWTPEEVRFAGEGAFLWAAMRGGPDVLRLYDANQPLADSGAAPPRAVVTRHPSEAAIASVAAGRRGDRVFALRQANLVSDPSLRSPFVIGYNPLAVAAGTMETAWSHDMNTFTTGAARLATDREGRTVAAAAWRSAAAELRVDTLDGTTGDLLGTITVPAIGLDSIEMSADGSRVAVTAGLELFVFDAAANLLHTEILSSATHALGLSASGSTIVFGELGGLTSIELGPAGAWQRRDLSLAAGPELPTRLDVSDDGTLIAVAWWNYSTGRSARLEILDTLFGVPLAQAEYSGAPSTFQNLPVAAHIAPDGTRAAFGLWGGGASPEVVILESLAFLPRLELDLPGSVRDLDFDLGSSTRLAVASKDVHSQVFGARGSLRVADTGERALQVIETPRIGASLKVAARTDGAPGGWFLIGPRAQTPTVYPGGQALLLDRAALRIFPALANADGRMDLDLALPMNPALVGMQLHVQSAYRTPAGIGFSSRLESPYVLD